MPTKFEITPGEKPNEGVLVLEPCYYGYGTTIGNALRRVLLSSLPGAAVTAIKIKGAQHEFSTLSNVVEDVLDIILNLKSLRLRLWNDEPTRILLKVKGSKKVTAADFEKNSNVEIVNPDLLIATLTDKKAELEMEAVVERGRGYVPAETRSRVGQELGMIMVDALYSPVRNVGYRVEAVRVGEITNYDRLIMNIETDGTITPEEAVRNSAQILVDYIGLFLGKGEAGTVVSEPTGAVSGAVAEEIIYPEEGATGEIAVVESEPVSEVFEEKAEKPKRKTSTKKSVKK